MKWFFLLVVLLGGAGCNSCGPAEERDPKGTTTGEVDVAHEEEPEEVEITADMLSPVFRLSGQNLSVELVHPLVLEPQAADARTSMSLQTASGHDVSGSIYFGSPTSLEFRPDMPLRPGTKYVATLVSVQGLEKTFVPETPWAFEFETPGLKFSALSNVVAVGAGMQATLVFSGPISVPSLRQRAVWALNGVSIESPEYTQRAETSAILATWSKRKPTQADTLEVVISAGVHHLEFQDVEAPAAEARTTFVGGELVQIMGVERKETAQGHYLHVICHDSAAPGGTRWYWNRSTYDDYQVSRRCMPSGTSLGHTIQIRPEVPNLKVTGGEAGFNLVGDFTRGSYTLQVLPGMATVDGGVVQSIFETPFSVPQRTAKLSFPVKGRYLPRAYWKKLPFMHLNVAEVSLEIRHVPEKNLAFWMSGPDESADRRTSNLVAKHTISLKGEPDRMTAGDLDISTLVPDPLPGLYEVIIQHGGTRDAVRLLLTDINLVMKRSEPVPGVDGPEYYMAWALDMRTAEPLKGVEVELVRESGQVVTSCKTGTLGGCPLQITGTSLDPVPPFAAIARSGHDVTFLKFDEVRTEYPDANVHGESYFSESAYRMYAYGDRDLYRPGEVANFVGVVRSKSFEAPPAGLPVSLTVRDARGRTLKTGTLKTNADGVVTTSLRLLDFADTGTYQANFYVAKKHIVTYSFKVEEFVPERLKVDVQPTREDGLPDAQFGAKVDAQYLFGASAAGAEVQVRCRLSAGSFFSAAHAEYTFGLAAPSGRTTELGEVKGVLDEFGKGEFECPSIGDFSINGPSTVELNISVLESGSGRATVSEATANVHPETYYLGLKSGAKRAKMGEAIAVEGVVVDWEGEAAALQRVDIEFIQLEREYYWWEDEGSLNSQWGQNIRASVVSSQSVAVSNGSFKVQWEPTDRAAGYVIRAKSGRTQTEIRFDSDDAYGWWYWDSGDEQRSTTPRPGRAKTLVVTAPAELKVGQKAKASTKIPFAGRLLTAVETHRVQTWTWHEVKPGDFEWEIDVAEFEPTAYVSAFLVRDTRTDKAETFLPERALGVAAVRILPEAHMMNVVMTLPKEVTPNSKLEVNIKLEGVDSASLTVAAVDEGVLQLTRYKTPDPSLALFAKRRLGVGLFETIGWAMKLDPGDPSSRTGGGDDWEEDSDSGGPERPKVIEPVALWTGVVAVKNGEAKITLDIPRYTGSLRVMAVATSPKKTGVAEGRVIVRDPLVLQPTLPRFLSAGDTVEIPVFVTNMTGAAGEAKVRLSVEDLPQGGLLGDQVRSAILEVDGGFEKSVSLAAGASGKVVFRARAIREAGVAEVRVEATLGNASSWDQGIVQLRPSGYQETRATRIKLKQGSNSLKTALAGWVPTSETSTIWVTSNPYGESFSHLKYLIQYPYGCIEQTTSSTRPLLYIGQFVAHMDASSVAKSGSIEAMVQSGLARIQSMQTSDGGFGYWPGARHSDPWGTVNATHLLLDAKAAGFSVETEVVDRAIRYIETQAFRDPNVAPYAHYVLARAGKGKKALIAEAIKGHSVVDRVFETTGEGRFLEQEYLLKAALYLTGDRRFEKDLKSLDTSAVEESSRWSYFYSDLRRRGLIFSTFHDLFGRDAAGSEMADLLGKELAKKHRFTTQELVWGMTALGKWVSKDVSFSQPIFRVGEKILKPTFLDAPSASWNIYRASELADPTLHLDKVEGEVFAVITSTGIRTDSEPRTGGAGLAVSREIYSDSGRALDLDQLRLGDVAYVVVTLKNTSRTKAEYLAMVDRLPAGFEIENPNLGRGSQPDWLKETDLWTTTHLNIRDDRVEVFGDLGLNTQKFVYVIRATAAGEFEFPPTQVEGMYEPEKWAAGLPARVKVQSP